MKSSKVPRLSIYLTLFSNHSFLIDNCFVMGVGGSHRQACPHLELKAHPMFCPVSLSMMQGSNSTWIHFFHVKYQDTYDSNLPTSNGIISIRHVFTPRFKLALVTFGIMFNIKKSVVWIPLLLVGIRSIRHIITPRFKLALV